MAGGPHISVTIDDAAAIALLNRALRRAEDLKPALREIGERINASTHNRFETETSPSGDKWAALAASTLAGKQKRGGSEKILQDTGRMIKSLQSVVGEHEVSYGTNIKSKGGFPYAAAMQLGAHGAGRGNKVNIPAREFLGVDDSDRSAFAAIIVRHLAAAI